MGNIFDESGVWRFRELLPFFGDGSGTDYRDILVSLDGAEGKTKPVHMRFVAEYVGLEPDKLSIQSEGANPTNSFKDNGVASGTTHAKMVGTNIVVCASTGNTSSSVAAYAANEGIRAVVLIGDGKIAAGKLAQTIEYGAKVIQLQGCDFDDAMKAVVKLPGMYLLNSLNPFRLEGQKTIVYRALEGLDWQPPDFIVYPGGNLGNCSAAGKALVELHELGLIKKMPRLVVVNAAGANTLDVLVNEKGLSWNGGNVDRATIQNHYEYLEREGIKAKTKASAIEILRPVNLDKALRALEATDGIVTSVTDQEMMDAKAIIGRNGFGCEPASAATVAGIKKLVAKGSIDREATVVGILTGHQLKDPDATVAYHRDPRNQFANTPILSTVDNLADVLRL